MDDFNFYLLIFPAIFGVAWVIYSSRPKNESERIKKENNRILAKEVNESFGSTKDDIRKKMNSSFENPILSRIKKRIPIIGKNK